MASSRKRGVPNRKHLEVVRRGVSAIAAWREDNRNSALLLNGADLAGVNLSGANLQGAKLARAVLTQAFLRDVDLREADLQAQT
jgi:uncharacterized protein YjbI with pentapeptide repeats